MQQYWKQSRFKQISEVRVPRNGAAKNISLRFPSITFILDITSVPEFILNYIRTAYSIKRVCSAKLDIRQFLRIKVVDSEH